METYIIDNGRGNKYGMTRYDDYHPMIHPYACNFITLWEELDTKL